MGHSQLLEAERNRSTYTRNSFYSLRNTEAVAVYDHLTRHQIFNFSNYLKNCPDGINSGMCFLDDLRLFLRNKTKLICHIAGHLYHENFDTALNFIYIYNDLYGSLTHLHASFFSISRGMARDPYFDRWLMTHFQGIDLHSYRGIYQTEFPEWKMDENI